MPDQELMLDAAQRLALALGIGFLIGIERGWKQRDEPDGERVAGLRTFTLAGLLGGLCGLLSSLAIGLAAALAIAFAAGFVLFHFRRAETDHDNSATSMLAGLATFGLGAYATLGFAPLAAAAAVAVTMILAFKRGLHQWLGALTWSEIRSGLLILMATFVVLPFLPTGAIDPWGVVAPRSLWLLTIVIACASFGGYVALRIFGEKAGLPLGAAIGGIVSSTAVVADLARRVRAGELDLRSAAMATAIATLASLGRIAIVAGMISVDLLARLGWPLLAAAAVLGVAAILLSLARPEARDGAAFALVRSPLDISSVLKFGLILGVLTIAAKAAGLAFGRAGLMSLAGTAGFVDVDAIVLAVANLLPGGLALSEAAEALGLALASNQMLKVVMAWTSGGKRFALLIGAIEVLAVGAAAAAFLL